MRAAAIGVVVAGIASFLVWNYMQRYEAEASGGPKIEVLTVTRSLEPGSVIRDGDIGVRGIPVAYVESRAIRAGDRQRITNLRISTSLEAQQILNWSDIVALNDERMLSNLVQPGMRAVAVHTEGRSSALPRAGDRVDVIATLAQPGNNEHRTGVVLLQNVLVLGHPAGGTGTVNSDGTDTILSLSLQQGQLIAVAGDKAKLTLALRPPEDVKSLSDLGEIPSQSLLAPVFKPAPVGGKAGPISLGGNK
jgi:Flp pilus assembly protein CpaB